MTKLNFDSAKRKSMRYAGSDGESHFIAAPERKSSRLAEFGLTRSRQIKRDDVAVLPLRRSLLLFQLTKGFRELRSVSAAGVAAYQPRPFSTMTASEEVRVRIPGLVDCACIKFPDGMEIVRQAEQIAQRRTIRLTRWSASET